MADYNGCTPLDIAIAKNNTKAVNQLLLILVKYQNHPLFNWIVDKNVKSLLKMNIQLSEYFRTSLPWFKIESTKIKDTCKYAEAAILISNANNLYDLISNIDVELNDKSDNNQN